MSDGLDLRAGPGEQSVALSRDFRLLQKRRGHRYSVDDMLVAHLVSRQGREPGRALDLGCGLGSVLLLVAWTFPQTQLVGLEALDEHVDFARRNVALNGCQDRARIVAGDLRDLELVRSLGPFDLITGSPPYFHPDSGTHCKDPARAAAHFELRGGIEEYAAAAGAALDPGGLFVCCAAASPRRRGPEALRKAGLKLRYRRDVIPRLGKEPFLSLLVGAHDGGSGWEHAPPLVLRDGEGARTVEHRQIREWTGV